MQNSIGVHAVPHAPQLAGSVSVSTHMLAQSVSPVAHIAAQLPAVQTSPDAQAVPHVPQFPGSVSVSTHAPPHEVSPVGQPQLPPVHISPDAQAVPQPPQFIRSVSVSTHAPVQSVNPVPHPVAQAPVSHTSPEAHVVPQAPQLAGSVRGLMQAPPQSISPAPHVAPSGIASLASAAPSPASPASDVMVSVGASIGASIGASTLESGRLLSPTVESGVDVSSVDESITTASSPQPTKDTTNQIAEATRMLIPPTQQHSERRLLVGCKNLRRCTRFSVVHGTTADPRTNEVELGSGAPAVRRVGRRVYPGPATRRERAGADARPRRLQAR
jgi:hypothetical protein